jgi:hypothetical protein
MRDARDGHGTVLLVIHLRTLGRRDEVIDSVPEVVESTSTGTVKVPGNFAFRQMKVIKTLTHCELLKKRVF